MLKIYWTLWAVTALTALLLITTGNLTMTTFIVIGFLAFGLIFMGMISVLPSTVGHNAPAPKEAKVAPQKVKEEKVFHAKHLATR